MDNEIKNSVTNRETWMRGLFILLFFLISGVARLVIVLVVLIQFLSVLFTGSANAQLLSFGQSLSTYVYQITLYLTFNSEWRPFPFGEWPESRVQ